MDDIFWLQHLAEFEHIRHCEHRNTTFETHGTMRFIDGGVEDTSYQVEVCKDCGAILWSELEGQDADIPF